MVILLCWLAAAVCVLVLALVAKRLRQDRLAARAVAALTADAESGTVEGSDYLYGFGWQGPMVNLIEQGRHYPEMERVMLLLEARRMHDWVYLYPRYRNADLRDKLIRHCITHFKNDPLVNWAAGRLLLAKGDYSGAATHLRHAMRSGFDPGAAGVPKEHFHSRFVTALVLSGKAEEAREWLKEGHEANPGDEQAAYRFLDFLCRSCEYPEVLGRYTRLKDREQLSPGLHEVRLRAYLWASAVGLYKQEAEALQFYSDAIDTDTSATAALLNYDFQSAVNLTLDLKTQEDDWWSEWISDWVYFRLVADCYAVTGDITYLVELKWWREQGLFELEYLSESTLDGWVQNRQKTQALGELITIAAQIARGHLLRGEWQDAEDALAEVDPEVVYLNSRTYQSVSALLTVSRGEELEAHSLASLASTGAVMDMLLGNTLARAAERAGITPELARQRIVDAIRPVHSNYWSMANDELDW